MVFCDLFFAVTAKTKLAGKIRIFCYYSSRFMRQMASGAYSGFGHCFAFQISFLRSRVNKVMLGIYNITMVQMTGSTFKT